MTKYHILAAAFYAILTAENFPMLLLHRKELVMAYVIGEECIQCGACEAECPEGAISAVDGLFVIDPAKCQDCGSCEAVCPTGAAHPA